MKQISIDELAPIIKEVVSGGSEFRLYPSGRSMYPTIVGKRDSVMLGAPVDIKAMDVVLYRRENGQYVLHRVVAVHRDTYDMCGDSQIVVEKNVPKSYVFAKMTGIFKNENFISVDDEKYLNAVKKLYCTKGLKRFVLNVKKIGYKLLRFINVR